MAASNMTNNELEQEIARLRAELARVSGEERTAPLKEQSEWLQLLRGLPDPAMILDRDGSILDTNDLDGLSPEVSKGESFFRSLPQDAIERARECLEQVWRTGEHGSFRIAHPSPDEHTRHTDNHVAPLKRGDETKALLVITRDITTSHRTELDLLTSSLLLSHTEKLAHIGTWQLDLETNVLKWSDENYRIFRGETPQPRTPETYESFLSCVHPDDRSMVDRIYTTAIKTGTPYECVHRVLLPDGRVRTVREKSAEVKDESGRTIRSVGFTHDITEQRESEEERIEMERRLLASQKIESLGTLAGGIAHDFNNLLTGVIGNADLALSQIPPESPIRDHLRGIEQASLKAADLSKQMLAYSGKGHFIIEKIDLRVLAEEMAYMLETSIAAKRNLRFDFADDVLQVMADSGQIRQAIMSLVVNASEAYGDEGGVITIGGGFEKLEQDDLARIDFHSEAVPGLYAFLEVADTGCGINEEQAPRVFDPFYSTKFTGRGLGLAAVQGIMRGHKGVVVLDSAPGSGTIFRLLFPAEGVQKSDDAHLRGLEQTVDLQDRKILFADDQDAVRDVTLKMFERLRAKVTVARDGKEALCLFKDDPEGFDCVILDLTMPRMDGQETAREIKMIRPDTKIILSSGYHDEELMSRYSSEDFAGFIQKPYSLVNLADLVNRCLAPRSDFSS